MRLSFERKAEEYSSELIDYEDDEDSGADYPQDSPEMDADVRMKVSFTFTSHNMVPSFSLDVKDLGEHAFDDQIQIHHDGDGRICDIPWECSRPCPIGYFRSVSNISILPKKNSKNRFA